MHADAESVGTSAGAPAANAGAAARAGITVLGDGAALFSGLKGFFVWLASSVAGVAAVLYAIGYLVTRAHLNMLGLYGLTEVGNDYFLQEGAKFFIVVSYKLVRTIVPLLALPATVLVAALVVSPLAGVALRRLAPGRRLAAGGQRLCGRLRAAGFIDALRRVAFVTFLFAALDQAGDVVLASQKPLCIANLFYAETGRDECGARAGAEVNAIRSALLAGDTVALDGRFESLLFGTAGTCVLIYLAWRLAPPWRQRAWLIAPLLLALALLAILLPMAYGVLERPTVYPLVRIEAADPHGLEPGPLFLLSRTDSGFVVWSAASRRVIWLPGGSVARAEVSAVENLFHAPAPGASGGVP